MTAENILFTLFSYYVYYECTYEPLYMNIVKYIFMDSKEVLYT